MFCNFLVLKVAIKIIVLEHYIHHPLEALVFPELQFIQFIVLLVILSKFDVN